MAHVHIYPEHQDLLDSLVTSAKVGSQQGAIATGPFRAYRDAYVFAASIGFALGPPATQSELPTSKAKGTPIRDSVFFGTAGAEELSLAAILLQELGTEDSPEPPLRRQLDEVADGDFTARLALLDLYAYAGFTWLAEHLGDTQTVRELVMEAIDKVACIDHDAEEFLLGDDALGGFLLDG